MVNPDELNKQEGGSQETPEDKQWQEAAKNIESNPPKQGGEVKSREEISNPVNVELPERLSGTDEYLRDSLSYNSRELTEAEQGMEREAAVAAEKARNDYLDRDQNRSRIEGLKHAKEKIEAELTRRSK